MNNFVFKYLSFVPFSEISLWDFKRYASKKVASKYKIVKLGDFIKEESKKIKPFEFPEDDFEILGVNNKTGLFDAYIEKGKNINQPYKVVEDGFLTYNPYRVNVGSIGLKTAQQKYKYISPAYVVFSCKEGLLPEFLYILFRTNKFNELIRDNTTGSVRQTLSFTSMRNIKIPLPTLEEQKQIVKKYNDKIKLAEEQERQAKNLENQLEKYYKQEIGFISSSNKNRQVENKNYKYLNFKEYKNLDVWSYDKNDSKIVILSNKYDVVNLQDVCDKITDGTHQTPKYENTGIMFCSAKDVTTKKINFSDVKYISKELHEKLKKRVLPKKNDILLAKNGTTGVAAIVNTDEEFSIYVSLALLRPNLQVINPRYLLHFINSNIAKIQFNNKLIGIGVPNLHLSEIKTTKIILPSLKIQKIIVEKIDDFNSEIDDLMNSAINRKKTAQEEFEKELFE